MRTQEDIVERVERKSDAFMDFGPEVLISFLDYKHAKPYLKNDVTEEDWKPCNMERQAILDEMRQYMDFAWGKAIDHRGLSTMRSVQKMGAWLWMLGDEEMVTFAENDDNYSQYGAPILKAICDKYEFPIPDDPEVEGMAKGMPCEPDCRMGCGR